VLAPKNPSETFPKVLTLSRTDKDVRGRLWRRARYLEVHKFSLNYGSDPAQASLSAAQSPLKHAQACSSHKQPSKQSLQPVCQLIPGFLSQVASATRPSATHTFCEFHPFTSSLLIHEPNSFARAWLLLCALLLLQPSQQPQFLAPSAAFPARV
jgi:hypothetical protein